MINIGISGKCGFQEFVESRGPDEVLDNYQVYITGHEIIPLKITSEKDLVAYYTYGTPLIAGNTIILSQRSYIDDEEQERMEWQLETLKKYWRKCKRKKIPFDKNKALQEIVWPIDDRPEEYQIELVNRVAELGEAATAENLHDYMHDRMRQKWYDLMVEKGWDETVAYRWVYGWYRYLRDNKNKILNNGALE